MTQAATIHSRGGWQPEENELLFGAVREAAASGKPLRDVFAQVGQQLNRKPNSIRNYYYARIREQPDLAPGKVTFRAFDQEELHQLLRDVLMARGRGESVRACVTRRAGGDRSAMLRYQNKYRSVLKNRPELLMEVAKELRLEGLPCPENVAALRRYTPGEYTTLPEDWQAQPGAAQVLEGLGALLRSLAAQQSALREKQEAQEATGMQVSYEKWLKARQEADRLRVEVDLLKIALEEACTGQGDAQPETQQAEQE